MVGGFLRNPASSCRHVPRPRRPRLLRPRRSGSTATAHSLTPPEKRRLEVARALATQPRILLLDEVLTGLTPTEARAGVQLIRAVRDSGVTVVMVEHVMEVLLPLDRPRRRPPPRPQAHRRPPRRDRPQPRRDPRLPGRQIRCPITCLEVRALTAGYRGLQALHGLDIDVALGEIVAVVGANGAGKSTLLRAIAGQTPHRRHHHTSTARASPASPPTRSTAAAPSSSPKAAASSPASPSKTTSASAPTPARAPTVSNP